MAWTYSGDPATSPKDATRFLVGDIDTADQVFSDEEIAYTLSRSGSPEAAAASLARAAHARYTRLVDKSVGDLSISYSQRAAAFLTLAQSLEANMSRTNFPRIFVGGTSIAGKTTQRQDTDWDRPATEFGQFDNNEI